MLLTYKEQMELEQNYPEIVDKVTNFLDQFGLFNELQSQVKYFLLNISNEINWQLKEEVLMFYQIIQSIKKPDKLDSENIENILEYNGFENIQNFISEVNNGIYYIMSYENVIDQILDEYDSDVKDFYNRFLNDKRDIDRHIINNYCYEVEYCINDSSLEQVIFLNYY